MSTSLKNYLICTIASIAAICSISCSDSDPSGSIAGAETFRSILAEDSLSGMLHVSALGRSAVLGSTEGRVSERPEMRVNFDYDFAIGRHEVTCGEFNKLAHLQLDCKSDSLPATNITFYDAVLYANAMSRAHGMDSAYVYSRAVYDAEGHCTNLDDYAFKPYANGFRLPTEAEWVLVASVGFNVDASWNAENSDYELHAVCSAAKVNGSLSRNQSSSELVICDMAGNAMEWVNDWLVAFMDTTITDFAGASDAGSLGERVVKGGSYRSDIASMNTYSRGDVYTVTSATKADYVGFRLAYGSIGNVAWLAAQASVDTISAVSLVSPSAMRSLVGVYSAKLAFRNDETGNLNFVNYASGASTVMQIEDTLEVYHPDISPDGNRVAFCTKPEGVSGKSSLYVRNLDKLGSGLVKLDVESAAIPRWRVTESGDTAIVYVTDAGNNKNDENFKSTSTWQVTFEGGKFGTPKKLFDGAYHGGVSESLAVTGARLLRARIASDGESVFTSSLDTVWYNGEQACNVSLAKDGSNRTLFLDFGSSTGEAFVGSKFRAHERLLVVDSLGDLIKTVAAPSGYTFDHTEWVLSNENNGGKNLAVATLTDANGSHTRIALVDIADSSVAELVEGVELWHPCLWVKNINRSTKKSDIDWDSAGVYLGEGYVLEQARYRIKMQKYWEQLEETEVLLVGSSRCEMGLNPDLFPEWNMLNVGVTGIDSRRDLNFIRNYALNHAEHLKAIVFSVDLDNWRGYEDHLALIKNYVPGYIYDENHGYWADGLPKGFIDAVHEAYPAEEELVAQFSERGTLPSETRGWASDGIDVLFDSVFTDKELAFLDSSLSEIEALVDIASEKGIYMIGILFPQAPQYASTGAYGTYGLQRSVAVKKIDWLKDLAKRKKSFILMDENKMGAHDYTDSMAQNRDHLSSVGAIQITTRLVDVLKELE